MYSLIGSISLSRFIAEARGGSLDIYSHTVAGLQKAAAERLDALLPVKEIERNVGEGLNLSRPGLEPGTT